MIKIVRIKAGYDSHNYVYIKNGKEILSFMIYDTVQDVPTSHKGTMYYRIASETNIWAKVGFTGHVNDISDVELLKRLLQLNKITQAEYLQLLLMVK